MIAFNFDKIKEKQAFAKKRCIVKLTESYNEIHSLLQEQKEKSAKETNKFHQRNIDAFISATEQNVSLINDALEAAYNEQSDSVYLYEIDALDSVIDVVLKKTKDEIAAMQQHHANVSKPRSVALERHQQLNLQA